jgi:multidrug efflux pump subunit AcrA (membrane-fusion protein)
MKRSTYSFLVFLLVTAFTLSACDASADGAITASGTLSALEVPIAPELGGRVVEINVEEGDTVKSSDPLFILDGTLLEQQRKVVLTNLELAKTASQTAETSLNITQAQYQVTLQAALAQDKITRLEDWHSEDHEQFDQPNWYFTHTEQAQTAQVLVDGARQALEDAKAKLADVGHSGDQADFLAAEQRLLNARMTYLITKDVNKQAQNAITGDPPVTEYNLRNCAKDKGYHYNSPEIMNWEHGCTGDIHLIRKSQALYDGAKAELEGAQRVYKKLLSTKAANDVLQARADVSVAQENYYAALDYLRDMQTGDQSPGVTAALGVVDQAQSAYDQSLKAIAQAQANLGLLDVQISKLTVYAPMDGVILARNLEVGELAAAGGVVMSIGQLQDMKLIVYIPETQYGQINIGQSVNLTVDSFPGQVFSGKVIRIANQAEFTPRNVQTTDGRKSTVYAVEITVPNTNHKLKSGMPADVTFVVASK